MTIASLPLLCLALVVATVFPAIAQPFDWQRCDTCYRNYSYSYGADSLFLLGAISVPAGVIDIASDSLRIRLLLGYPGPTSIDLPSEEPGVLATRAILERARHRGMKMLFPPVNIARIGKEASRTLESYAGSQPGADSMQVMVSGYRSPEGRIDTTLLARSHVWAWEDYSTSGATHQMIARPRFTSTALADSGIESELIYSQRNALNSGDRRDSTSYVRLTFTVAVDSASLHNSTIADEDVIAFGVIYRRDTSGQQMFRCANYVVVDTVTITRRMLTDSPRDRAGDGYTNIHSRYYHAPSEFPRVPGFDSASSLPADIEACRQLRLGSPDQVIDERDDRYNSIVEGSDRLVFRFYTTRRIAVRYLRTSISQHSYMLLATHQFDSIIQSDVDAVYDTPLLDSNFAGFGVMDEPNFLNHRAYGILSSKIQDFRNRRRPDDTRRIFSILYGNYGTLRALSGDIDSTRYKLMQGLITNDYFTEGYFPLPVKYANPDSLSGRGLTQFFRADSDSAGYRQMIFYNDTAGYLGYLRNTNGNMAQSQIGSFFDSRTAVSTTRGPFVPNLARAIDVSRYRNNHLGPGSPVYSVVTIHGYLTVIGHDLAPGGYDGKFLIRPPTPEEITVQCWLALNCNADGIVFSHFDWDGRAMGITERSGNHGSEYAELKKPNDSTNPAFFTGRIWTGFASRFAAVKRFSQALKQFESVYRTLDYRREQISVHDLRQSFEQFPMVGDMRAELADRDRVNFTGTRRFDTRDSTYLEITHYHPGSHDTVALQTGARYLLVTNRRCWPIDFGEYSATAAHGGSRQGLGNIDVRRPWITLKNSTGIRANRFIIEKVGREGEWSRMIEVSNPASLDWLEPGWGELYRIRPLPSETGTTGGPD